MDVERVQQAILQVKGLKTYFLSKEGTFKAVDGVDFHIKQGETLGIVGESGCGKSVTAQSVLRILPSNGKIVGGQILLRKDEEILDLVEYKADGEEILDIRGKEIAMIFQEPMTSFSPVYTIGNQIMEAVTLHRRMDKEECMSYVVDLLDKVGLPQPEQLISSYPFQLSGGMRQRALIAMALSCKPKLLIADEPTTAVDVTIQAQVLQLINSLKDEFNMAIMLITHDMGVIAELADRVMIMYLGKSVESSDAQSIFDEPLHPYTKALLNSIPKLGGGKEQELNPIEGTVPSLYELPKGCKYHTRCSEFMKGLCDVEEPRMEEVIPGHYVSCFLHSEPQKSSSHLAGRKRVREQL